MAKPKNGHGSGGGSGGTTISYLDAYDWLRQVIRNQSGYDNIRRDDSLQGVPRLGFDSGSLRNVHASLLNRFVDVELKLKFSQVNGAKSVEELLDEVWKGIPDSHKKEQ